MSPATFAILALAALVLVTHIAKLAFELTDGANGYQGAERKTPSHIA